MFRFGREAALCMESSAPSRDTAWAMSEENVEAMRKVYDAMARGDFWAAGEVFDPEIEWSWSSSMSGLKGSGPIRDRGCRGSDSRILQSLGDVPAGGRGVHRGRR